MLLACDRITNHVELTEIINKLLLLHLVGCLHYYIPFTFNLLVHNFKLYHCRQISVEICDDQNYLSCSEHPEIPQIFADPKPTVNSKILARFQDSFAKQLRTALFGVVTQRAVAIFTDVSG